MAAGAQLPCLLVVQALLGVGVVVGFAFLVPSVDPAAASCLGPGVPTIALTLLCRWVFEPVRFERLGQSWPSMGDSLWGWWRGWLCRRRTRPCGWLWRWRIWWLGFAGPLLPLAVLSVAGLPVTYRVMSRRGRPASMRVSGARGCAVVWSWRVSALSCGKPDVSGCCGFVGGPF